MNPSSAQLESCTRCGYSLAGLPPDAACPECSLARPGIGAFLFCPGCGYHLAGLKADGDCPECAKPVSEAIADFPVYRSGLAYIDRVASGARLLLVSAYMVVGAFFLIFGMGLILPLLNTATGGMTSGFGGMIFLMLASFALMFGASVVWLIGWIRATTPDPVYRHHAPSDGARGSTRGLAIAIFCTQFGYIIPFVNLIVWIAQFICLTVMFYTATSYIRAMAGRIPDPKLGASVGTIRKVGTCILSVIGLLVAIGLLDMFLTIGSAAGVLSMVIVPILMLVMLLVYLRLIARFAKTMKQTRRRAVEANLAGRVG